MSTIVARGASFLSRLKRINCLTGGYIPAIHLILMMKLSRSHKSFFIDLEHFPLEFRRQDEQVFHEIFVDDEYGFSRSFLAGRESPTILDVGAHIGAFAAWVLNVSPKAHVLSVEADPGTYTVADRNATRARKMAFDWTVMHAAAAAIDGIEVMLSEAGPSMSHRIDANGTIPVKTTSLSCIVEKVAQTGRIDLLKIDIEGSEEDFLCNLPDKLDCIDAVIVELHPKLCDTQRVRCILGKHYSNISEIGGRVSSKPLLFCSNL